ncbi:hypothetical protein ACSSNL_06920 [Thalassobius sp. S69A]|uniref:hypothetical protein n=1 Tax=unclassified Thalassovita TaxID=2619711 RepID=UPI003C7DCAB1
MAPDVVTALGTLLAGGAACAGVLVAGFGLDSWRRERDSDCAKRLAAVVYSHRLALLQILHPWPTQDETDQFELEPLEVTSKILHQRWSQSRRKLDEVNACLAEADLRWKGKATKAYESVLEHDQVLFRLIGELRRIEMKLADLDGRQELSGLDSEEQWKKRDEYFEIQLNLKDKLMDTFDESRGSRKAVYRAFEPIHELLGKKL